MSNEPSWKQALSQKSFRVHLLVSSVASVFLISFIPYFFNTILLPKPGILLNDFVLNQLAPKDWSWIIFSFIYASVLLTVISNYSKPFIIILGFESYIAINLIRMITLYFITLEPPQDIIPLTDPLITKIVYDDVVYLKDLFFSGHVSTLFLLFLIEENKLRKFILLTSTIAVAFLIIWQHVHYSVDVLFAPVIAWAIYSLIRKVQAHHFLRENTKLF